FSLFTCCTVHAFDVQTAMRRLSLKGECLAALRVGSGQEPTPAAPPRPGFALLPALRSLLGSLQLTYRRGFHRQPLLEPAE
ncbi:MAG TPA: hypothetical protein VF646_15345, partial [Cytophagales bacterium]